MNKNLLLAIPAVVTCLVVCMAAWLAWAWTASTTYRGACLHATSGYEKFGWVIHGRHARTPGGLGAGLFPAVENPRKFAAAGIAYDSYEHAVQCGEPRRRAWSVNAVRFTVARDFSFVPSAKYAETRELPRLWLDEAPAEYVPLGAEAPVPRLGSGPQAWLASPGRYPPGRKAFVDTLEIGWLKDEPLDEAHLLGVWQGGWLFRSARPGYYVWVD